MKSATAHRLAYAIATLTPLSSAGLAVAKKLEQMMAKWRERGRSELRTGLPDVETKSDRRQIDGKCSFNKFGSRIIQFIVNQQSDGE
jgi:hypothetical protein